MKRIYKRLFILLISIAALFLFQGVVNAESEKYGTVAQAYEISPNYFCMNHYEGLYTYIGGDLQDYYEFDKKEFNEDIEPSTAYALWIAGGGNPQAVQHVIWASAQWTGSSNVLEYEWNPPNIADSENIIEKRAYQYGTVYYEIFSKLGADKSFFTVDYNKNDLKVMVDQKNKTYTVGPYTLKLNVEDASEDAKKFLLKEITGDNDGFDVNYRFANYAYIEGLNGEDPEFLNDSGDPIKFPDFISEEEFYIRFKPNDDGNIDNTGAFKIRVNFLSKIGVKAWKYEPQKLWFDKGINFSVNFYKYNPDTKSYYYNAVVTIVNKNTTKELKYTGYVPEEDVNESDIEDSISNWINEQYSERKLFCCK